MAADKTFKFQSEIARLDTGLKHHYLALPTEVSTYFLEAKIKRVLLTLNGHTFRRAIQGRKDGERRIHLGKDLLKTTGLQFGDTTNAILSADPNPDQVDIPEVFKEVLDQDEAAGKRFYAMTPGKQRSLCVHITQVKSVDAQIRRSLELAEKLRTYTLSSDLAKRGSK